MFTSVLTALLPACYWATVTELITQAEFSKRCKVNRTSILKAVRSQTVELVGGKIDFDSASAQEYYQTCRARSEMRNGPSKKEKPPSSRRSETGKYTGGGNDNGLTDIDTNGTSGQDELLNAMTMKKVLEVQKLKAEIVNKELKNKVARAEVGDIAFLSDIMLSLLQQAFTSFKTLPDAVIDDIIADAMVRGTDSRQASLDKMYKRINNTDRSIQSQFKAHIARLRKDMISGHSNQSGDDDESSD